ncbi:NAD(P)-binding domain-containing protein [Rhodococcus qingshengii]
MIIGFVGTGRMGAPMVRRLALMGEAVRVHARPNPHRSASTVTSSR